MQFINIANEGVKTLSPYQAGKPIEELERENMTQTKGW